VEGGGGGCPREEERGGAETGYHAFIEKKKVVGGSFGGHNPLDVSEMMVLEGGIRVLTARV